MISGYCRSYILQILKSLLMSSESMAIHTSCGSKFNILDYTLGEEAHGFVYRESTSSQFDWITSDSSMRVEKNLFLSTFPHIMYNFMSLSCPFPVTLFQLNNLSFCHIAVTSNSFLEVRAVQFLCAGL